MADGLSGADVFDAIAVKGELITAKLGVGVIPVASQAAYTQTYSTAARTHTSATGVAVAGSIPAGGTGAAAGGWDTAGNRDTAITTITEIKTTVNALVTDVLELKKLINAIIDDLQAIGISL